MAIVVVEARPWHCNAAAIDQTMAGSRAHQDAHGVFADNGAGLQFLKRPGQAITTGCGPAVNQHAQYIGARLRRLGLILAMTPVQVIDNRALHQLKEAVGKLTTPVETLIDNKTLLVQLTIEHPHQLQLATVCSIGHIDIAQPTVRKLFHHAAVVFNPLQIAQQIFLTLGQGPDGNRLGIFALTSSADQQ